MRENCDFYCFTVAKRRNTEDLCKTGAKREKYGGFGQISRIRWVLPFYGGPKNPAPPLFEHCPNFGTFFFLMASLIPSLLYHNLVRARNKLIFASALCLVFMIGEIVGGVLSNSLAIATDAAHLLTGRNITCCAQTFMS